MRNFYSIAIPKKYRDLLKIEIELKIAQKNPYTQTSQQSGSPSTHSSFLGHILFKIWDFVEKICHFWKFEKSFVTFDGSLGIKASSLFES